MGYRIRYGILKVLVLVFVGKFVASTDLTMKSCMEKSHKVSDRSYPTALAYYQKCLELGKNASKESLPTGYFGRVVDNMKASFEVFLEASGLGQEELAAISEEIANLTSGIRHIPRKKATNPSSRSSTVLDEVKLAVPKEVSHKPQSKKLCNSSVLEQPENTLRLQFVNNIWPNDVFHIFTPEEQSSADDQQHDGQPKDQPNQDQEKQLQDTDMNANKSSAMRSGKCTLKKSANKVEVMTLFLCILTLAVCVWMAYKIYCQYQLWTRVRYEASNHKTETTPLNRSESCISQRNDEREHGVCYSKKPHWDDENKPTSRGFLE